MVLWVAATTADGPILFEISRTHGVHRRDAIVAVRAYGFAGALWVVAAAVVLGSRD